MARRPTLLIAFTVLSLALVVRPALSSTARITPKPAAGPPTSKVRVSGAGFGATEVVVLTFDATQVATATTGQNGGFSMQFKVPASALPGGHTLVATGQVSGLTATAPFTVQTNWSQLGFDSAHTGANPFENVIGISNVATLTEAWTAATAGPGAVHITVANGAAYLGVGNHTLDVFDATGTIDCSGTPKSCTPLWTAVTGGTIQSAPAVATGVVYVSSEDGKLYAFDAAGVTNCSGTPKTCKPLWTSGDVGVFASSPTVAGRTVYVGGGQDPGKVFAFDAAGVTNCSGTPKTCIPLWTGETNGKSVPNSSPAVSGGMVFVGSSTNHGASGFDAFDAAGVTNCSGTPKTCTPLWTATTGSIFTSAPAVANGKVYVVSSNFSLFAFDAAGLTNCSGTPKFCNPLWTSATQNVESDPVVVNGRVYVGTFAGLEAFDAAGLTNCAAPTKRCSPLWTGLTLGLSMPLDLAVANGLVYATSIQSTALYAFDAAGVTNCSGTPVTCLPVWTQQDGSNDFLSPVVVNGIVYVTTGDGILHAFSLP